MKAIIDGLAGGDIEYVNGSDQVISAQVLDNLGAIADVTGGAVALNIYSGPDRAIVIATKAGVLAGATEGHVTFTIEDTDTTFTDLNPGSGLSMAVVWTDSGGIIELDAGFTFRVK